MIPPTSIDGTDITGATIDGTDVQEITVDGQTVFTAVPPPPQFAIHQWKMDEGTGTTVADSIGSLDATLQNGAGWQSDSNAVGGTTTDYDGSNDIAEVIGSSSFYEPNFAIGVTAEFDDNNRSPIVNKGVTSASETNSPVAFDLTRLPTRTFFRVIQDSTDTRTNIEFSGNTSTGQKYRFFCICDTNRIALFVNGQKEDESNATITIDNINEPIYFGGDGSGFPYYMNGKLDNIIFYENSTISDSVAVNDYNIQPWTP